MTHQPSFTTVQWTNWWILVFKMRLISQCDCRHRWMHENTLCARSMRWSISTTPCLLGRIFETKWINSSPDPENVRHDCGFRRGDLHLGFMLNYCNTEWLARYDILRLSGRDGYSRILRWVHSLGLVNIQFNDCWILSKKNQMRLLDSQSDRKQKWSSWFLYILDSGEKLN